MLDFDGDFLAGVFEAGGVDLGEGGGADGAALEVGEEVVEGLAGVVEDHGFDGGEGGDGAFVLEGDECVAPFVGEEVVEGGEVLAEFDEYAAIFLHCFQSPFRASLVAG